MSLARRSVAVALWLALLVCPALSSAQAIINTSRSNIKNIALQLDGAKDTTDLLSVEGGQLVPDITLINTAPFQRYRQIGKPKFEDFTITLDADIGTSLADWVSETLAGKARTRSGHMIVFDDKAGIVQRLRFYNALITEVSLPALDGSAKDSSFLMIAISPTTAESAGAFPAGTRFKSGGVSVKQKQWHCANFRIRFDGAAGFDVAEGKKGLNAVNVKQARQIATSEGPRYQLDDPRKLDSPDLEFTSERWATEPYAEDVQRMLQGIEIDHTVSVDYLNDAGDVLFTLRRLMAVYKTTLETGAPGADVVRVSMVGNADPITIIWAKK